MSRIVEYGKDQCQGTHPVLRPVFTDDIFTVKIANLVMLSHMYISITGTSLANIISGIVDTDNYDSYINYPIIINGDKYPNLKTILKAGTPYAQVIPFKRDNWKMEIGYQKQDERWARLKMVRKFLHNYKELIWSKKSWK